MEWLPGPADEPRQLLLDAGAERLRGRSRSASSRRRSRRIAPGLPRALAARASAIPSCAGARAASTRMRSLLSGPVRVVNIGLAGFARDLAANGAAVAQVDWAPPKAELLAALSRLSSMEEKIEKANREALARILAAEPVLADVRRAGELIPELDAGRLMLHAGPPIAWARMCGPLRGAVCGAIVFEGWAPDLAAAEQLAASGGVKFAPNHHYGAVGPMTGITTRSMPLLSSRTARSATARCAPSTRASAK